MKAYLDLAYEYEADNVLLVLGEYIWNREVIPPQEQWSLAVDACRELGDYAGIESGTVSELEPFKLSLVNSVETMVRFLDDCDHKCVNANIDISHLVLAGVEAAEWKRLAGRAIHVHISDCDGKVHGILRAEVSSHLSRTWKIRNLQIDGAISLELNTVRSRTKSWNGLPRPMKRLLN